jgi:hypothetical protein
MSRRGLFSYMGTSKMAKKVHVEENDIDLQRKLSITTYQGGRGFDKDFRINVKNDNNVGLEAQPPQILQSSLMDMINSSKREKQSSSSSYSSFGVLSKYPNAHEIAETLGSKLVEMIVILTSIVVNIGTLILASYLAKGITVPFSPTFAQNIGGVTFEFALLATNILASRAMDCGSNIYFAILLSKTRGYSMAACGFSHASSFNRINFTSQLSLNSTCRSLLRNISLLWLLPQLLLITSPIISTGLNFATTSLVTNPVSCITFDSTTTFDRKYPTFEHESGVAELIFGNALGCMRSQRSDCLISSTASTFIFGPQLEGSIGQANSIIGPGYSALISTSCSCKNLSSPTFSSQGYMTTADLSYILGNMSSISTPFAYLASNTNVTSTEITLNVILANYQICGGYTGRTLPVCATTISNAENIIVLSTYIVSLKT